MIRFSLAIPCRRGVSAACTDHKHVQWFRMYGSQRPAVLSERKHQEWRASAGMHIWTETLTAAAARRPPRSQRTARCACSWARRSCPSWPMHTQRPMPPAAKQRTWHIRQLIYPLYASSAGTVSKVSVQVQSACNREQATLRLLVAGWSTCVTAVGRCCARSR